MDTRAPLVTPVLIAGCIVIMLGFAIRASFGVFQIPIAEEFGWLRADFSLANELEFSKSIATGEVKLPSFFFNNPASVCRHSVCKTNALLHIQRQYGISPGNSIAIGDSANDLCMIKNAGVGVALCSADELLNFVADVQISERSFGSLLEFA